MFAGTQGKSFHQYFKKLQQTNAPFIMTKNIFTLRKFLQISHSKIVSNWSLRTVSESYLGACQTFMMELFLMIFKEKYIIIVAWQYPKYAFEFENVFFVFMLILICIFRSSRKISTQLYEKRDSDTGVFLWILQIFMNTLSWGTPLVASSTCSITIYVLRNSSL